MRDYDNRIRCLMEFHRNFFHLIIKGFELGLENREELNPKHYQTIMALFHGGSCTMHDLSTRVMLQKGSFTPVANKLLSIGFIRKERSAEDKRMYFIHLTDKGVNFANGFSDKHHSYLEDKFSALSSGERDRYFELLYELRGFNEKMTL